MFRHTLNSCGVHIARFSEYVLPFFNILYEGVKWKNSVLSLFTSLFSRRSPWHISKYCKTRQGNFGYSFFPIAIWGANEEKVEMGSILELLSTTFQQELLFETTRLSNSCYFHCTSPTKHAQKAFYRCRFSNIGSKFWKHSYLRIYLIATTFPLARKNEKCNISLSISLNIGSTL